MILFFCRIDFYFRENDSGNILIFSKYSYFFEIFYFGKFYCRNIRNILENGLLSKFLGRMVRILNEIVVLFRLRI